MCKPMKARVFALVVALVLLWQLPVAVFGQLDESVVASEEQQEQSAVVLQEPGEEEASQALYETEKADEPEPGGEADEAETSSGLDSAQTPMETMHEPLVPQGESEPSAGAEPDDVPEPRPEPDEIEAGSTEIDEQAAEEIQPQPAAMSIAPFAVITAPAPISSLFPDALFAAYIAGLLGRTVNDTVTQNELNTITTINPSGAIYSVEGIQYLNGAREVRLDNLQLTQRIPQAFISDIYPNLNFYIANNQRYYSDTLYVTNPTLQVVYEAIPPIMLQIAENSGGAVVGTWVIMNEFSAVIDTIPAVNGQELLNYEVLFSGSHIIELQLNNGVWMGLDNSIYYFPIVVQTPSYGTLTGTVTDQNGNPLSGVTITLGGGTQITTDANGRYTFEQLPQATYNVTASLQGYNSQTKQGDVTLGNTTVVDFVLVRDTGSLHGLVLDERTVQPIAGAAVVVTNLDTGATAATRTTAADGSFTVTGLPAGLYRATASYAGYSTNFAVQGVGGNQTTEMTIYLAPVLYTLTGIVYDESTGLPIEGATVSVPGHAAVTTGADGRYTIQGLQPGSYAVTASAGDYGAETVGVDVNQLETQQDIPLRPSDGAVTVRAVYYDPDVTPLEYPVAEGVTLTLSTGSVNATDVNGLYLYTLHPGEYTVSAELEGFRVEPSAASFTIISGVATPDVLFVLYPVMVTVEGYVYETGTTTPVEAATVTLTGMEQPYITGEDGYFVFTDVAYGSHTLAATAEGYGFDRAIVTARTDGQTIQQNLFLDPSPASLNVQVYYYGTNEPVAGAAITLNGLQAGVADENGNAVYTLAQGTHTVSVTDGTYTPPAQSVVLEPGGNATLVFYIHRPPALVGNVADMVSRIEIEGATLTITGAQTGYTATQTTGADGHYAFIDGILPDAYTITVMAENYQTVTRIDVEVADDEIVVANFFLVPQLGSLTGTVMYADGTPVPNTTITLSNGEQVLTDEDGHYYFLLYSGEYTVSEDADGQIKPAEIDPLATTVVDFVLELEPGNIYGVVTDAAGSPLAGATITVYTATGQAITTTTDINGAYTVAGLAPGGYTVVAGLEGYGTAAQQVQVLAATGTEANFVLDENPGVLEGVVTDAATGQPIPGATVTIGPDGIMVVTDENGYYRIPLVAGSYTVTATATGYEPGPVYTVRIEPNTAATQDITLTALEEGGNGGDDGGDGDGDDDGSGDGDGGNGDGDGGGAGGNGGPEGNTSSGNTTAGVPATGDATGLLLWQLAALLAAVCISVIFTTKRRA